MRKRVCSAFAVLLAAALLTVSCAAAASYTGIAIENKREVSEAIRNAMMNRSWRVTVRFDASTMRDDDVKALADGLIEGALYESDDPCGGDYLRFQYGGYEVRHSVRPHWFRYAYTIGIYPDCYTTAEQEAAVDERIREIIADFGFDENTTDLEKTRAVRDFIYDTVSYDTVHKENVYSHMKTTAYAALFYHTAVCQGYAVLAYRLLKEAGVDTRIVTGWARVDGAFERHAWNLVCVDGLYYNMDITLDKATGTDAYFLKADNTFVSDHKRDKAYRSSEFYDRYPMAEEDGIVEK